MTKISWQRGKKLSAEQVREIRRRISRGETRDQIALDYDVGPYCIRDIAQGRSWAWLD